MTTNIEQTLAEAIRKNAGRVDWGGVRPEDAARAAITALAGVGDITDEQIIGAGAGVDTDAEYIADVRAAIIAPLAARIAQLEARVERWEEWSNRLTEFMPEEWDGDEAQEAIIERFVEHAAQVRERVLAAEPDPENDRGWGERIEAFFARAEAEVERLEAAVLDEIDNRDRAVEWADRLAAALAPSDLIGEHSSNNDPWANALEWNLHQSLSVACVKCHAEPGSPCVYYHGIPLLTAGSWQPLPNPHAHRRWGANARAEAAEAEVTALRATVERVRARLDAEQGSTLTLERPDAYDLVADLRAALADPKEKDAGGLAQAWADLADHADEALRRKAAALDGDA